MKREIQKLSDTTFDLVIIGGGITGAFSAWDAISRGLSVVLVEKDDFGGATSSASGKLIHGGIRYLQYGALHRVRESLHERMVFRQIAPHFVYPIPFLIPTYGHLLKGREVLKAAMTVYDLLSIGKRNSKDPSDTIPKHRILQKNEVLELEPGLEKLNPNGGALYSDCQMHNSERLTLSVLMAAEVAGACLSNYAEVIGFKIHNNAIKSVHVHDKISGNQLSIRGKYFLNAAGPWAGKLLAEHNDDNTGPKFRYSKGVHIITRPLTHNVALALASRHQSAQTFMQRGGRHLFIIPWRNHSIVGTTNVPYYGNPDNLKVTEKDISDLVSDINLAYPSCRLDRQDVCHQYSGLYLDESKQKIEAGYQGGRRSHIIDHRFNGQIDNMLTAICVKYTTARKLACQGIDLLFKKMGKKPPKCKTHCMPVHGGDIPSYSEFLANEIKNKSSIIQEEVLKSLIRNYGSEYAALMAHIKENNELAETICKKAPTIKAQVIHAVKQEMAMRLSDVIFRRTGLGTLGNPGDDALNTIASLMARELGWDKGRKNQELKAVKESFDTIESSDNWPIG